MIEEKKTITVKELQAKLNNNETVFILDVRPTEQRKEWKIDGSIHVDAYDQLRAGDETALDVVNIPANANVVTVCAAGRTSQIASELLASKGVNAYSLEGGMKAWNYAWNTAELRLNDDLKVIQVRRAAKGVLSYIVGSAGEAVIIDAALDPDVYTEVAASEGWTIKFVMDTHIHADYVSRTRELAKATGAVHLMINLAKVDFEYSGVSPDETISFGKSAIKIMHTPGHTWESATFLVDKAVFTGDTLFVDGIGRPDLKADRSEAVEKAKALYHSLKKIFSLSRDLMVLPAHTPDTVRFDGVLIADNIGNVLQRVGMNKFDESQFVAHALSKIPPTPPNYETIVGINRKGVTENETLADLEAGGNHCAIA